MSKKWVAGLLLVFVLFAIQPASALNIQDAFVNALVEFFSPLKNALDGLMGRIIGAVVDLMIHVSRPAEEGTKDLWGDAFAIYISVLFPLAMTVIGFKMMFSTEPPSTAVFKDLVQRVAWATMFAFFSFTIIDTLVYFTNSLADLVLGTSRDAIVAKLTSIIVGGVTLTAIGAVLIGVVELGLLFLVLVILGIRQLIIHFIAAFMPVLAIFLVVGVGPLRRLSDFVYDLWGWAVILPVFSVIAAGLIRMVEIIFPGVNPSLSLGDITLALGVLAVPFLIPLMMQTTFGMFSTGVGALTEVARPVTGGATSALRKRTARVVGAYGLKGAALAATPIPTTYIMDPRGAVQRTVTGIGERIGKYRPLEGVGRKMIEFGQKIGPSSTPLLGSGMVSSKDLKNVMSTAPISDKNKLMSALALSSAIGGVAARVLSEKDEGVREEMTKGLMKDLAALRGLSLDTNNPDEMEKFRLNEVPEIMKEALLSNIEYMQAHDLEAAETFLTLAWLAKDPVRLQTALEGEFGDKVRRALNGKAGGAFAGALAALGITKEEMELAMDKDPSKINQRFNAAIAISQALRKVAPPTYDKFHDIFDLKNKMPLPKYRDHLVNDILLKEAPTDQALVKALASTTAIGEDSLRESLAILDALRTLEEKGISRHLLVSDPEAGENEEIRGIIEEVAARHGASFQKVWWALSDDKLIENANHTLDALAYELVNSVDEETLLRTYNKYLISDTTQLEGELKRYADWMKEEVRNGRVNDTVVLQRLAQISDAGGLIMAHPPDDPIRKARAEDAVRKVVKKEAVQRGPVGGFFSDFKSSSAKIAGIQEYEPDIYYSWGSPYLFMRHWHTRYK